MIKPNEEIFRENCYKCYRPTVSCMCKHVKQINTNTKFILLMHPKEFKKTKNKTGHLTNLSLKNSELHIGIDFSKNIRINELINNTNNACYIIYPGEDSIKLNNEKIKDDKNIVLFLIDSTWACSKKMIRESKNLRNLPKVSFTHNKESTFYIKQQPANYCLSTIESTLCIIELLNAHKIEDIKKEQLSSFLNPFKEMVDFQLIAAKHIDIRYRQPNIK